MGNVSSYLHIVTFGLWYDEQQARIEEAKKIQQQMYDIAKRDNFKLETKEEQLSKSLTHQELNEHGRKVFQEYLDWNQQNVAESVAVKNNSRAKAAKKSSTANNPFNPADPISRYFNFTQK